ncbi:uncharacterized protein LOC100205851 [Hydra vulgaris]|uniref:uncharacterized protein LOC100205851 n=1 Tax=Hydra vulgaris TaxID=6087 RepID=UPI0001923B3D|nr:universal stress protein PHOS32 [Hydra vulgaris]
METGRINCLAVDASETSELAFNWYAKNYHRKKDTLIILHIHEVPQLPMMGILSGIYPTTDEHRKTIEDSVKAAKAVVEKFKNLCVEREIEFNEIILDDNFKSPGHMICELVKKKAATVVVLGQRGLGAVSRTFLGSTSDYVLHHSNVPVIVIPPTTPSQEPTSYYK